MQNYDSQKKLINPQIITIISVVFFFVVALVNLVSTNILSTQGISVSQSEAEILNLEKQNHFLSVKIEESTKLSDIEQLAKKQGFVRVNNLVFAPTPATVALR